MTTRIAEVMAPAAYFVAPDETIAQAAILMREKNVGSLAVGTPDALVGMLTDRDVAVRAVAGNKGAATPIRDIMDAQVGYCYDDDEVGVVARNMADSRVHRLLVVDRDKRLVGFVALGNVAVPGGAHRGGVPLQRVAAAP